MQAMDLSSIEKMIDDGFCVINGREYEFDKMKWKDADLVSDFFTKNIHAIEAGQISLRKKEGFLEIRDLLFKHMSFDGHLLSKIQDSHFDEYRGDYYQVILYGLSVFSYPFIQGLASA